MNSRNSHLSSPKIEAVIFDMDGLMLDTERLGRIFWKKAAQQIGFEISDEVFSKMIGRPLPANKAFLKEVFGADFPFEEIHSLRLALGRDANELGQIKVKSGLIELLDYLTQVGIKFAVATSTAKERAIKKLEVAALSSKFEEIISGDDVINGKPSPDIFLKAAQLLAINQKNCLVFEDSEAGILGARDAEMIPVLIPDIQIPSEIALQAAYATFPSLREALTWLRSINMGKK